MDVYKFINSKDIAAYLKQIDYRFSPLEIAYLVYQSLNTTLDEKFSAWQEIIDSMPDCVVEERRWFKRRNLHDFLSEFIRIQKKFLQEFYVQSDRCAYTFNLLDKEVNCQFGNFQEVFPDLQSCLNYLDKNYLQEEDYAIDEIEIKKLCLSNPDYGVIIVFNRYKAPKRIDYVLTQNRLTQQEKEIIDYGFDGLWFALPTPFKKGDILYNPYDSKELVFVLCDMCSWGEKELIENGIENKDGCYERAERLLAAHKKDGDESDMIAAGYCMDGNLISPCHTTTSYLNLQYYRQELTGVACVLTALSNYLKGKIDISSLMCAYYHFLSEENYKESKKFFEWFTKEDLFLAGIKRDD
ncbi:MAG: hypothetical protein ACI4MN_02140 [Candidatus Coproplasma sp.]